MSKSISTLVVSRVCDGYDVFSRKLSKGPTLAPRSKIWLSRDKGEEGPISNRHYVAKVPYGVSYRTTERYFGALQVFRDFGDVFFDFSKKNFNFENKQDSKSSYRPKTNI